MARFDHVVRVVRLIERLTEARAGLPLRAIADELDVCERTARRYLEALERGGYSLDPAQGGRYRLARRSTEGSRLTAREQRQLLVAAIAAFPLRGSSLLPDMKAIVERLSQPSPAQQDLFARARLPLAAPNRLAIDYRLHEALIATLLKGLDERQVVQATYYVPSRDEETRRAIDPYSFYYEPSLETLYLFAYCHLRKEVRTFALHRFRKASLTRRIFQVSPDFSVERHLGGAFRVYRGRVAAEVQVRFAASVAHRITERRLHASQRVARLPGGAVDLHLTVDGFEEVEEFVMSFGEKARVVAPEGLVERVARGHREAAGQYEPYLPEVNAKMKELAQR